MQLLSPPVRRVLVLETAAQRAALLRLLDAHVPRSHALRAILRHAEKEWRFFELTVYSVGREGDEDAHVPSAAVAAIRYPHSGMTGVYTFAADDISALDPLLAEGTCFSWRSPVVFAAMQGDYKDALMLASMTADRRLEITPCGMYLVPSLDAIPRLDEASLHPARIGPLSAAHAPLVNRHWPYGSARTELNVRLSIECFGAAGVFVDGEPVAWAVFQPYGAIGMVHVLDEHRRKGYGTAAVRGLIDRIRDGLTPIDAAFCYIVRENTASIRMFEGMGFVEQPVSHDWWTPAHSPSD